MRLKGLLHKIFMGASQNLDKRIHAALLLAAEALLEFRHLSIAGLGRTLNTSAKVKHAIKRMDRLFGNLHLQEHKLNYYQEIVNCFIKNNKQPIIVVDWSGLTRCGKFHFLRAAIPVGGRALPILDLAFSISDYMTPGAHQHFLRCLKAILPKQCYPIIVTDAGFRCPWFKLVKSFHWNFVGRIRHKTRFSRHESQDWHPIKMLYQHASAKETHLFNALLTQVNKLPCEFYLIKENKKNRVRKNLAGKKIQCSVSKKHEKRENEPWLIVTSLSPENFSALQIINIYKKRMQIEESFRDLKNMRNGFGLRHCRSSGVERLNIALLIGALAMWVLWVLGAAVKAQKMHWEFQSNTTRHRNVLSHFTIGWQFIRKKLPHYPMKILVKTLQEVAECTQIC